jgi:2-oxoglutarate dehydrogenase E1 component
MNLEASQERLDNHYTFMRNEWLGFEQVTDVQMLEK